MNINRTEILAQNLSGLTYNGDHLQIPQDKKLNLFMGIGLWSVRDGLSSGLPIDVFQMLLSAAILRAQVLEANPQKPSKVIILIADSMAINEGAEKGEVARIVAIYKRCLDSLLETLNLKGHTDVMLSSELEEVPEYQATLLSLEKNDTLQKLKEDQQHYAYIFNQTAMVHYMHVHRDVGVKVGWICANSSKHLTSDCSEPGLLKNWDELKFDMIYKIACPDSKMQYLYAKAGLKQLQTPNGHVNVIEGCPYTAYSKQHPYLMKIKEEGGEISIPSKRIVHHWTPVVKVCASLTEMGILQDKILPKSAIYKTNNVATVQNMLKYWSNMPVFLNANAQGNSISPNNQVI
jgi:hypothetical protein